MVVMGSNIGGLAGQQLFRTSDAPKYTNGFLAILCLYAAALVMFLVQIAIYYQGNRKLAKEESQFGKSARKGSTLVPKYISRDLEDGSIMQYTHECKLSSL